MYASKKDALIISKTSEILLPQEPYTYFDLF